MKVQNFTIKNFILEDDEDSLKEFEIQFKEFLTNKIEVEHQFSSLVHIGFELLISILLGDSAKKLGDDLKRKFSYGKLTNKEHDLLALQYMENNFFNFILKVNLNVNYNMKATSKDSYVWFYFLKYYFELYVTYKSFPVNDGPILVVSWRSMCSMSRLNFNELNANERVEDHVGDENLSEYRHYFLLKTIEYINNFSSTSKNSENVILHIKI